MRKKSYSQYQEDLIIWNALQKAGIEKGKLLDIGAWHPIDKSNSRLLIEKGWQALLIEPSPWPLHECVSVYGNSSDVVEIVGAAVGINAGLDRMKISDDAVSSTEFDVQDKWKETGGYIGWLHVPVITLQQIFDWFGGPYQFVSIDTEGTSVPLAMELLKTEALPYCICVEHDNRLAELMQVAEARGYAAIHINGTNVILECRR
jgi:FkbM family methyltransferase